MRIPSQDFKYIGIDDEGDTSASYEGEVGLQIPRGIALLGAGPQLTRSIISRFSRPTAINHFQKTSTAVSHLFH
jgi:hypothetical protein